MDKPPVMTIFSIQLNGLQRLKRPPKDLEEVQRRISKALIEEFDFMLLGDLTIDLEESV